MTRRDSTWRVFAALLLTCGASAPTAESARAAGDRFELRVQNEKAWNASKPDIEKVLRSAAGELLRWFPDRKLDPIEVDCKGGPIVLFQRGPKGEYRVKLDTGGTLWAQYSFQFSHETCHILCNYKEQKHHNKWFEESVCELASLFAMRRMSETWKTDPPYPNWRDYAKHLAEYAEERMVNARLPDGVTLAEWYEENKGPLSANATDRDRNQVVATVLLPLFEQAPEHWEAVTWLNTEKLTPAHTFRTYLAAWRRNCPDKHKEFVAAIARQFKIELEK